MSSIRSTYCLLMFCLFSTVGYAQVFLRGRVIDAESKAGVPYVNISVGYAAYGTSTDEDGDFFLRVEEGSIKGTMKLSCIGYQNTVLSLDSLAQLPAEDLVIQLASHTVMLDEVVVREKAETAEDITRAAIEAIPKNYIQTPFHMEFYGKVSILDSVRTHFTLETILDTYRAGYTANSMNNPKIVQKRTTGTDPLSPWSFSKEYNHHFTYPPNFDLKADLAGFGSKRKWTIFNPRNFRKLHLSFHGATVFDDHDVYIIKYSERTGDEEKPLDDAQGKFHGFLYINQDDLAIVLQRQYGDSVRDIIYRKIGDYYYPHVVTSFGQCHRTPQYFVRNEIFLRHVDAGNTEPLEPKIDDWIHEIVPYDENFWNSNYPVKNDHQ